MIVAFTAGFPDGFETDFAECRFCFRNGFTRQWRETVILTGSNHACTVDPKKSLFAKELLSLTPTINPSQL
jgi:hypothetical protein